MIREDFVDQIPLAFVIAMVMCGLFAWMSANKPTPPAEAASDIALDRFHDRVKSMTDRGISASVAAWKINSIGDTNAPKWDVMGNIIIRNASAGQTKDNLKTAEEAVTHFKAPCNLVADALKPAPQSFYMEWRKERGTEGKRYPILLVLRTYVSTNIVTIHNGHWFRATKNFQAIEVIPESEMEHSTNIVQNFVLGFLKDGKEVEVLTTQLNSGRGK